MDPVQGATNYRGRTSLREASIVNLVHVLEVKTQFQNKAIDTVEQRTAAVDTMRKRHRNSVSSVHIRSAEAWIRDPQPLG